MSNYWNSIFCHTSAMQNGYDSSHQPIRGIDMNIANINAAINRYEHIYRVALFSDMALANKSKSIIDKLNHYKKEIAK